MAYIDDILALLPDNTTGQITAAKVREAFNLVMPALDATNPTMVLKVPKAGLAAQMQVMDTGTNHAVATMEWLKATQEFIFNIYDRTSGASTAIFELKPDGNAYVGGEQVATMDDVAHSRSTIEHNIVDHAKPTLAECKTVFKLLPHFDWKKDDDFYIKDTTGGKIVLIKYRSTPAATEAAPGNFFYEVLTLAK